MLASLKAFYQPTWLVSDLLRRTTELTSSKPQSLVEEQLSDSREWLFDSALPSLADISVHFVLAWAKSLDRKDSLFDVKRIPNTLQVSITLS